MKKNKKDHEGREPKKEKNLILKVDNSDSGGDDADMAYLTRRFQKMVHINEGDDEQDDTRMIAVESEAAEYDSIFALMAKSDEDEDDNADEGAVKESIQRWYMDNNYSKHVTGSTNDFLSLKALEDESVPLGNSKKGYILGVEIIGKTLTYSIENVYYVNDLKYSLPSVSQICNKGTKVEFFLRSCTVTNLVTGEVVLMVKRFKNIYVADFESLNCGDLTCLSVDDDDSELWHRILGHASFSLLNKLVKKDLVRGLPKLKFKDHKVHDQVPPKQDPKLTYLRIFGCKYFVLNSGNEALGKFDAKSDEGIFLGYSSQTFLSQIEPKNIKAALKDADWIASMQDELHQFERNYMWHLVPQLLDRIVIGTRWVLRNKLDEFGNTIRNKVRLVVQGYNQEEGIDYDEIFTPVAQIEAIRILIAFAFHMKFKLFQMHVKSAFLNGYLKKEVFVKQPPGFECHEHPKHVFKLDKALYGLKQANRTWYERLSRFVLENGFTRGKIDNTLFLKKRGKNLLIVEVYVDNIIFGTTNDSLCEEFSKLIGSEFEMSIMGALNFFLGLQVKQTSKGTMISQQEYNKELLKRFEMESSKTIDTPISTATCLDMDKSGFPMNETMYWGIICSLLYLTTSRPDIVFSVGLCSRF
uniref:Uncharacterized protein LOC104223752 n=1 Tax=Nicotiana sylvestris TaxID=4096 RepID=A0A1U7WFZ2_NICSY|nr:PREDICTED: uncharacterized protein LOC104223752 [Nicotiana sylvestris]